MNKIQAFGQYVFHFKPLALYEGSRPIQLPTKQLEVLALLVQGQGKPIPRNQFREQIWKNSYIEDSNLTQAVFLLRKALGKLPDGCEFIETIPGFGYRLAAGAIHPSRQSERQTTGFVSTNGAVPAQMGDAEQFRLLVESIDEYAIYMLDCTGRVVTWNAGAEKNKGYSIAEVLGKHYSIFFVPEDITARLPERHLSKATMKGKAIGEGWRIRKNGERYWASFVITAIRNRSGKLLGFAKVVRDLSEHKRQEDAKLCMQATLQRERDRFQAAAESSMDALFICDAVRAENGEIEDFVFTYLNRNVETMVAIPRAVLLGGKMCELLPIHREPGFFDAYARVVQTGRPYIAEFPISDPNISFRWLRIHAVPLENGIAITASDITSLKREE